MNGVAYLTNLYVHKLHSRRWFKDLFGEEAQEFVVPLLLALHRGYLEGRALSKKEATALMRADPGRTTKKYIDLCEELGLLVTGRAEKDKREQLLAPTPLLVDIVEKELKDVVAQIDQIAEAIGRERTAAPLEQDAVHGWADDENALFAEATSRLTWFEGYFEDEPSSQAFSLNAKRAVEDYTDAIRLMPENPRAYAQRAGALGRSDKALADLEKAIELDPDCKIAHSGRVDYFTAAKRYDEALAAHAEAIRRWPNDWIWYAQRGELLRELGRDDAAREDLLMASRLR